MFNFRIHPPWQELHNFNSQTALQEPHLCCCNETLVDWQWAKTLWWLWSWQMLTQFPPSHECSVLRRFFRAFRQTFASQFFHLSCAVAVQWPSFTGELHEVTKVICLEETLMFVSCERAPKMRNPQHKHQGFYQIISYDQGMGWYIIFTQVGLSWFIIPFPIQNGHGGSFETPKAQEGHPPQL